MDQTTHQNIKFVSACITGSEVSIYWLIQLFEIANNYDHNGGVEFFNLGWAWFSIPMIASWIVVLWARMKLPKFFK